MHPEKYLTLHRNHPPLMYLLYSSFSHSLWTVRVLNAVIGATIPVLVYLCLDDCRRSVRIIAGTLAAISTVLVQYSGIIFLDTLSSTLFVLGIVLYRRSRWLLAGCAMGLSILAKEYAILGAAILIALSYLKYRSTKRTVLLGLGFALAMPIVLYFLFYLGGSFFFLMVAHDDPLNSVWNLFLFLSVPLALISSRPSRYEECLVMTGYAAFITWWRTNLDWYLVLPFPLMIVCLASSLDYALIPTQRVVMRLFRWQLPKPETRLVSSCFLIALAGTLAFTNIWYTAEHIIEYHPHELQGLSEFLSKEEYFGRQVTLVECAWPYTFYPFGHLTVVYCDYPVSDYDEEISVCHIRQTRLAIIGDPPSGQRKRVDALLHFFRDAVVHSSGAYYVISLPGQGNATIPSRALVTFRSIDKNGNLTTEARVGSRIFFAGTLIEQPTAMPLQFRSVHLYANLLGRFITPYPGELEWTSEITDAHGCFDTRWVDYPFKGNLAEWIEIRGDGIYFNGKTKIWSGNPRGLNITFHADFLGSTRDEDIYARSEDIVLTISPDYEEGMQATLRQSIGKRPVLAGKSLILTVTNHACRGCLLDDASLEISLKNTCEVENEEHPDRW